MIHKFFLEKRPHKGFTYNEYMNEFKQKIESTADFENEEDYKQFELLKLNFKRSTRIQKTYSVSPDLLLEVNKINEPQIWMMITENWCGDSAQILPFIAKIAECNSLINYRIIERDKNPDIMGLYLTNGTRSIPKLVVFDESGNELFQWGSRPLEAQNLIMRLKAEGKTKDEFIQQLHLWYAKDKGKHLELELLTLLQNQLVVR